ncbi:DUF5667 domain-containing protein [Streptomyces sp. ICBB 8177]|uniref:DUF5667 domain-containing protein n=1 Tax=Streptomyces sp. ICBB 8177 TaxID=563922 RepID=UPI000D67FA3F|nr:DUF5667 domain-containing protein [Streptomyces sp. ICBB 8177]PWI45584.1 hypothetical protein CK485_05650 [Streptomyces sp. ICBB 8177]
MIGQATAHRRANAFAQGLESMESAGTRPAGERESADGHPAHAADRHADPQQGQLLAVARAVTALPKPQMDAETKTVQRAQLIAAMEAAIADGSLETAGRVPEQRATRAGSRRDLGRLRPRTRWSRRLAAGGLAVGVTAGAFTGVAAASTNALPGDTLYGLKRGMEDLRLGMAGDDAARGQVLLDMASTRMQEARRLMERGRSGPLDAESVREVRGALLGMHNEAAEGHQLLSAAYKRDGSLAPIEALNAFQQQHGVAWDQMRKHLPSQLTGVGDQVTSVFTAIQREVAPLRHLLPATSGAVHHDTRGGGSENSAPGDSGHEPSGVSGSPSGDQGRTGHGKGSAAPSASTTSGQGLIGGNTGGLLNPAPTSGSQPPASGGSGSGGDGRSQPGVTVPPLLPGLLPGLGITGGDDSK